MLVVQKIFDMNQNIIFNHYKQDLQETALLIHSRQIDLKCSHQSRVVNFVQRISIRPIQMSAKLQRFGIVSVL